MKPDQKDIQLIALEVISGKQRVVGEYLSSTYALLHAELHNKHHLKYNEPMHEVYVLYSKSHRTFRTIDPYFGHKKRVRQIDAYLMKIEFCQEEYREHPQLGSIDYDQFKFVRGENLA
ncbi:hypothetical protein [Bacillus phage vB_Bpu_PumA2]|uniref:Uncharacterized protein n=1 Tax=Bacillus phage vB_Bpu_PumA2 TaxID=2662128 RepID=A0A5Q2WDA2_9CAUD|nr:hypothetical protein H3021_gp25 [Bacillus phage vB_Bpu_PumA2]QGH74244.1 hypothetical protein [Bacillus phage vB_Bpu_PumA2]